MSVTVRDVQTIMGRFFVSPQEIEDLWGVKYTDEEKRALERSIPPRKVLRRWTRNDIVLLPAPPQAMSLTEIYKLDPRRFVETPLATGVEKPARVGRTTPGWLPIKAATVGYSHGKCWRAQRALVKTSPKLRCKPGARSRSLPVSAEVRAAIISGYERVPNAVEAVWFAATFLKLERYPPYEGILARVLGCSGNGWHAGVGVVGKRVRVAALSDVLTSPYVGLAAAPQLRMFYH